MDDWAEFLDEYEEVIKETPTEFFNVIEILIQSTRMLERVREYLKTDRQRKHRREFPWCKCNACNIRAILAGEGR